MGVTISYLSCIRKELGAFASGSFWWEKEGAIFLDRKSRRRYIE